MPSTLDEIGEKTEAALLINAVYILRGEYGRYSEKLDL